MNKEQEGNKLICEGNCIETHGEHRGEVKQVFIIGWTKEPCIFCYCQNAVEEDERRGFVIKPCDESGQAINSTNPKEGGGKV